MKKSQLLFIIALITLGSILRVYKYSQLNTFAGDEGKQLLFAEDILHGNFFPSYGEASSLDESQTYQVHNSPLGIYFQTLLYLLSGKTAEGYLFSYVVLNIFTIFFLFKTLQNLGFHKAALVSVVLLSLSPHMLHAAVWTSQPINALFFESLAIYLLSLFFAHRNDNFFLFASIASLFATQMYPPMYLLLIPKVFIFLYIFRKFIHKKKKVFLLLLCITVLTYIPYLIQELKYDFSNSNAIREFLSEGTSEIPNTFTVSEKFSVLLRKILAYFSYEFKEYPLAVISYIFFQLATFIKYKKNHTQVKVMLSFLSLTFFPIIVLSLLLLSPNVAGGRAYIDIIFPFLILFFAILHENTKKELVYLFLLIYILITLVPMRYYFFTQNQRLTPLVTIKATTQKIIYHSENSEIEKPYIHVISAGDKWGWDSTIYWYLLEKSYQKDLVRIDFDSHKPKTITPHETNKVYVVCHNVKIDSCINDWNLIAKNINYRFSNYNITESFQISQNYLLVLEEVAL